VSDASRIEQEPRWPQGVGDIVHRENVENALKTKGMTIMYSEYAECCMYRSLDRASRDALS
jgi:hypothetical protein